MNKSNYYIFSINIIVLFFISILASFIPEYFSGFFGDYHCNGAAYEIAPNGLYIRHGCDVSGLHNPTKHWGYRHYLWSLMGIVLFVAQVVRIINSIIDTTK
jgi:hypothetical protein